MDGRETEFRVTRVTPLGERDRGPYWVLEADEGNAWRILDDLGEEPAPSRRLHDYSDADLQRLWWGNTEPAGPAAADPERASDHP
jgi:hypothetical protein